MSESIKLNDNRYIDAEGVYDHTQCALQSTLNAYTGKSVISKTSTTSAWSGDTLTFNLSISSITIYEFTALGSSGAYVKDVFIIRNASTIILHNYGSASTYSYDSTNSILTITMPVATYWTYNLRQLDSRH